MQPQVVTKEITLEDGRTITIETGKLARQADGAVVVRMGDTMLLATVVSAAEASEKASFFPLSVDYQEKFASAGRIPGGFLKREGRLSDTADPWDTEKTIGVVFPISLYIPVIQLPYSSYTICMWR